MMSVAAGRAARFSEVRGHGKPAALKDQRYRARIMLMASPFGGEVLMAACNRQASPAPQWN